MDEICGVCNHQEWGDAPTEGWDDALSLLHKGVLILRTSHEMEAGESTYLEPNLVAFLLSIVKTTLTI